MSQIKRKKSYFKKINFFYYFLFFIFLLGLIRLIIDFSRSLFFVKKDRINVVFYNQETQYYSLDTRKKVNYYLNFPADLKINVPGGYGKYRLGGIGKLIFLEKKPSLLIPIFSNATSSFIDFYFYFNKPKIYYGFQTNDQLNYPSLGALFYSSSNASFFNRLYLFYYFLITRKNTFSLLPLVYDQRKQWDENKFFSLTQGYFYQESFYQENLNLQIIYPPRINDGDLFLSSSTKSLVRMIEGEGIRVSDLTPRANDRRDCLVLEDKENFSASSKKLSDFFHCQLKRGKTNPYDIILILNDEAKRWIIN